MKGDKWEMDIKCDMDNKNKNGKIYAHKKFLYAFTQSQPLKMWMNVCGAGGDWEGAEKTIRLLSEQGKKEKRFDLMRQKQNGLCSKRQIPCVCDDVKSE